jgi:hypothetical protein
MLYEKQAAYVQASSEMALQMFRINLELGSAMFRAFSMPWHRVPSAAVTFSQTQQAVMAVLAGGLAPFHRTAVSNARRLSKTPLRPRSA